METRSAARLVFPSATPLWLWPNLLSLDAPAVGLVWQELFARTVGLELGWAERAVLGLSIWLVYAADRWMDVVRGAAPETARHRFALQTAAVLPGVWLIALVVDVVLAASGLERSQLAAGLGVLLAALIYFALVHFGPRVRALPTAKEGAVGIVFSGGATFAMVRAGHEDLTVLVIPALLLVGLAWANCSAIEESEQGRDARWPWFLVLALLGATAAGGALWSPSLAPVGLAAAAGALSLAALRVWRESLPADALRVAADGALLVGPLFLLAVG